MGMGGKAMITARQAFEALRLRVQVQADAYKTAALDPDIRDAARAEARTLYGVYQVMVSQIAQIQAEGFSDPDPIAEAVAIRRTVQNCLNLNNVYQEFFEALVAKHGQAGMEQVVAQSEMMLCFMLHWYALNACFSEQGAEQQIADVRREIERLRGQAVTPPIPPRRSSTPIQ